MWLLCSLHMMPDDLIIIRLSIPHDIFRARLTQSSFSGPVSLFFCPEFSHLQDSMLVPVQLSRRNSVKETCSLSSPSQQRIKADKGYALRLREHSWEVRVLRSLYSASWEVRTVFLPSLWVSAQIPTAPSFHP